MKFKSISQMKKIKGKRVLLRVDFNIKIENGKVDENEDFKLRRTVPTIEYLLEHEAKIIIASHLGRPKGKVVKELKLDPIVRRLSEILDRKITKVDDCVGKQVETKVKGMADGDILVLENLRFHSGEKDNDKQFAKQLASLADIYVNDAFAVSHRRAASVVAITKFLPSYAGLLLQQEVKHLSYLIKNPKKPLIAILGGAKISTKLQFIEKIARVSDYLLVGGGLANTFLASLGYKVGKSLIEPDLKDKALVLYNKYKNKIILPMDVTVDDLKTPGFDGYQKNIDELKANEQIIDVGTRTVLEWSKYIKQAQTVFWNGPLGIVEDKRASHSSRALVELLAARSRRKIFTVAGGGETVWLINDMGLYDDFDYISTGGGAMLDFLRSTDLPGIKALKK